MMTDNLEEYIPPKRPPPTLPKNDSNSNFQAPITRQQNTVAPANQASKSNFENSSEELEVKNIPKRVPPRPPTNVPQTTAPAQEQKSNSPPLSNTPSQNDPKPQTPPPRSKPALPPKTAVVNPNINAKSDYRYSQQVPKAAVPPSLPPKPVTLRPGKTDWNDTSYNQTSSGSSTTSLTTNNNSTVKTTNNENSPRSNQTSLRTQDNNNNAQTSLQRIDPAPSSTNTPPSSSANSPDSVTPTNSNPPLNLNSNPSPTQNSPRIPETLPPNQVIREGFLVKKGHKRTNWLIRWFRLTNESLSYYSSSKAEPTSMKGSIPLNNPSDIQLVDKVEMKKRDNCFIIRVISKSKEYVIDAQTQSELQQWLSALKKVLRFKHEVIQTIVYEMQQK